MNRPQKLVLAIGPVLTIMILTLGLTTTVSLPAQGVDCGTPLTASTTARIPSTDPSEQVRLFVDYSQKECRKQGLRRLVLLTIVVITLALLTGGITFALAEERRRS